MALKNISTFTELKPKDLRWKCDPNIFDFKSTDEIEPIEGILGQDRAIRAIKLGVNLKSPGYNIYISGLSGTGKASSVKKILESMSSNRPLLYDYSYVNNFQNPDNPCLLVFPAGDAKGFRDDMNSFIGFLKDKIPQALEGDNYLKKKKKILELYSVKEQELVATFEAKISHEGFSLGQIQVGETARPEVLPIIKTKPTPISELEKLVTEGDISKPEAKKIYKKYTLFQTELAQLFKKGLRLSQSMQKEALVLEQKEVEAIVTGAMAGFKEKYTDKKILVYLDQVEESILENLQTFKGQKPEGDTTSEGFIIDYFKEYEVNIILDNTNQKECPVIVEISPSFTSLFGTIEKINDGRGGWYADFTKIKAGSLLKANGGFLVLNVNSVFEEPGVWRTLKRVLTHRKLEIQDSMNYFQFSPSILKPELIDVDTKVILIGSSTVYSVLAEYEYDFKKIFKVRAEFDDEITRTSEVMVEYARVIKRMIKEESLLEFDKTAIASLLELAARYAGQKNKLTSRFSMVADLAREANFWAHQDAAKTVKQKHVDTAYAYARDRHALSEEKISEMIKEGSFLIETDGERVGQINGLAVYGNDLFAFGKPSKITAAVALGNGAIINVEREAGMSGSTYNKGVLIISGYFRETFGQDFPLSFSANLVFEQSYGMIDGDSASAAEIFILLSQLSGVPIKQSIAVTGSINQKGDIQPIGGVNEKIEGFFETCKLQGLTDKQGVIIPIQNVKDLMLKEEIITAVKKGSFHIYPINRIEEGIQILTGFAAGEKNSRGHFPIGTIYHLVYERLKKMYVSVKHPFDKHKPKSKSTLVKKAAKKRGKA
ncbi:MAG: AAA family ATPase [Ignavibacteria bacterium]|nr:AAA family ATPase [Ignavibacteria bacterium]